MKELAKPKFKETEKKKYKGLRQNDGEWTNIWTLSPVLWNKKHKSIKFIKLSSYIIM